MLLILSRACIQIRRGVFKCRSLPMSMSNQRIHWVIKSKWTRAWKDEVKSAIVIYYGKLTEKIPIIHTGQKTNIEITLFTCSFKDCDNAYGSIKPILDGLTESGIIIDDSPEYINLKVDQKKVKHNVEEKVQILINYEKT